MVLPKALLLVWFQLPIIFGASIPNTKDSCVPGNICLTETCVQLASQLFDNMNLTVDPCHDFYEFACGNFIRNQEIPDDQGKLNSFGKVVQVFEKRGRVLLEKEHSEGEWEIFKHFRRFYKACMNESAIEENSLPLMKSKLKSLGGWPILEGENWSEDGFNLEDSLVSSLEEGFPTTSLFSVYIGFDIKSDDRHIIQLDQGSFGISREFLAQGLQERTVQAYLKYMKQVAQHFGANPENLDELDQVLEFEMDLAKIALKKELRGDDNALYNEVLLEDVPVKIITSWPNMINNIFAIDETIPNDEKLIIKDLEYFQKLDSVLEKHTKRTLANYLGWRTIQSVDSYLDSFVLETKQELFKTLRGKEFQPARWKRCVKAVGFNNYNLRSYQVGVGSMYVQEYFPPQAREIIQDMLTRIRTTFSNLIADSDWMDEETIAKAQVKLEHMSEMIGYPDELLEEEKVTSMYEGLELDDDQYLQNHLNGIKTYNKRSFWKLRKPTSDYKWEVLSKAAVVNAFYQGPINSVLFNAAFLQGSFFQDDAPMYKNFGAVGMAMGHEITHGFDDRGRKFDHDGKLKNWWNNATDEAYYAKTQCFIDLYNELEVEEIGMNVNGRLTLNENIADFGGVRSTHLTYEKFLADMGGQEMVLPGLPFTPMQLFWIFHGQTWCSAIREETLRSNIINDYHSPARFRINVPLSNYAGFAKDFECKPSDQMVEAEPCRIW